MSGTEELRTWSSAPVRVGLRQPLLRPNTSAWDRREAEVRADLAERQYRESAEAIAL